MASQNLTLYPEGGVYRGGLGGVFGVKISRFWGFAVIRGFFDRFLVSGGVVLAPFLVDFCLSVRRVSSKNGGIGWVRGFGWAIDIDFNLSVRRVSSKNQGSIERWIRGV